MGRGFLVDSYHRPIDPRRRLRCNRLVNGQSTRGGQRNRRSSCEYTIADHGGDSPVLLQQTIGTAASRGPLKHQQDVLDDVNVHVWKESIHHDKQT